MYEDVLHTFIEDEERHELEVKVYCVDRTSQKPNPSSWDSDMDYYGYDELEIGVSYPNEDSPNDSLILSLSDEVIEKLTEEYKEEFPAF